MQGSSRASIWDLCLYCRRDLSGVLELASGNFATTWQHVGSNVPLRQPLAYLTAVIELAAGLALLWRRTARAGAVTLTVVYSVFTLFVGAKGSCEYGRLRPHWQCL